MSKSKSKISLPHLMFYLAGLLLVISYLLVNMPSPSADILTFVVKLFLAIVIVGFYCFFIFGANGCSSTIKALAPCILLIIICGKYSISLGNATANKYIVGISEMAWLLLIVCGFVYLFVKNKVIGVVFTWATIVYLAFIIVSYVVTAIIAAVDKYTFDLMAFFSFALLVASYTCIALGSYKISKAQSF